MLATSSLYAINHVFINIDRTRFYKVRKEVTN